MKVRWDDYSQYMENNPNVPNHQPVNIYVRLVKLHTIYTLLMVIPFHGNSNKMGILIMYKKMDWRLSMWVWNPTIMVISGFAGQIMIRGRAKGWSFNWVYHIGFSPPKKRTHGKLLQEKEIGRIFGFPNFFTQIWCWLRLLTTQISNCGMVLIASHPKKSFMARF